MSEVQAYHNSHSIEYRQPFGAVECGRKVILRLAITGSPEAPVQECLLRLWDREQSEKLIPMSCLLEQEEKGQVRLVFEVEYILPQEPGLVWYFFKFIRAGKTYYYGNNHEFLGGEGELREQQPPAYQITVYRPSLVPEWFKKGIIYQIYVDRFHNGDKNGKVLNPKANSLIHGDWYDTPFYIRDEKGRVVRWTFFGGNLQGVIEKLPYLQELGISIIYFNPIFEAASNHKYDTGDYKKIDPMYGDDDIFVDLVKEADRYGISVILDGVFSHTGSDSIYFNKYGTYPGVGAFQSTDSPYYKWYKFNHFPQEYESWWRIEDLPNVDEMEPSYQEFIFRGEDSVVRTWMGKGVKGWRLDVADELPDEFIKGLRKAVKAINPQAVLIGEVWEDASHKVSYGKLREYFWGDELDSVMNYPLRTIFLEFILGKTSAGRAVNKVMSLYENYPRENFQAAMNLIGSHDRVRTLTVLGEAPPEDGLTLSEREHYRLSPEAYRRAVQRLKLISLLQMTFPGVPAVYYGDEAGVEGFSDPYNRGTFPWKREDQEITNWYKKLIRLRKEYQLWKKDKFRPFHVGDDVFGFRLSDEEEEIEVYVNRNMFGEVSVDLGQSNHVLEQIPENLLILDLFEGKRLKTTNFRLQPLEGKVIYKKNRTMPKLEPSCGILLHLTSLPSPWGIGDLGREARKFIDFLAEAKQKLWQVLPFHPPGEGYSPYQCFSVFAGNPLLISLEALLPKGLLNESDISRGLANIKRRSIDPEKVAYSLLSGLKQPLLRKAFLYFKDLREEEKSPFFAFLEENSFWIEDYCLYQVLKEELGGRPWYEWEKHVATRDQGVLSSLRENYRDQLEYQRFLQYLFFHQWQLLKKYAHEKGVKIIGDLPIYVAADSCDTWVNQKLFSLDGQGKPLAVAGVPPDYFSKTGQLWGNPLYNWEEMEKDNFRWWQERIKHALKNFDYIRLDHFRGFESYWEVPASESTAVNGRWLPGPGKKFFEAMEKEWGVLPFIAEDLGNITPEVHSLKKIFGFPGMKVYQFTSLEQGDTEDDWDQTILYSGTHDNDTLLGWVSQNQGRKLTLKERKESCKEIITQLYGSKAPWVILPMQDVLMLGQEARMNIPGTVKGNWKWRMKEEDMNSDLSEWLKNLADNR